MIPDSSVRKDLESLVQKISSDSTPQSPETPWHSLLTTSEPDFDDLRSSNAVQGHGGPSGTQKNDKEAKSKSKMTLHLSLTKPFSLKTSQRDLFKSLVRKTFKGSSPFVRSFVVSSKHEADCSPGVGRQFRAQLRDGLSADQR